MHDLNDYGTWRRRAGEIRREVELNRRKRTDRGREPGRLATFWWELRRDAGRLRKIFRRGGV
ncbi:MAG: hypothetical protein ACFB50_17225 [Rubrobacteraceae bacterium]